MITYNLFSIIMMIVPLYQYQLHWSVWLMLMTLNMIIYLPFAMLVFARSYVLLDEK